MHCSVIILNWNGIKWLKQFLPTVVEKTKGEGVEVVVADNGSTDESVDYIKTSFPSVKLITFSQNYGFAEGYNRAISEVDAEYVVLLNSDVEVTDHWLEPMLNYLDKHPDVVAVQPKILSFHHKQLFEHAGAAGGYLDRYGYPFCRGRVMSKVEEDHGQYDSNVQIFWASGACLVCRRDDYIAAGGLDSSFFAHMEEIDLCWRWNSRGKRLVCVAESKVYHVGGGALDYKNARKTYLNFRNNLIMLYKNLTNKRLLAVMFVRFWLDYLAALVYLLKGERENFKAVLKARKDYRASKKQYKAARKENLKKSIVEPQTISKKSIFLSKKMF